MVKNSLVDTGDTGSIPGSRRSSGEGNGNPLQYSCLENPMDSGALCVTVQGDTTQRPSTHSCIFLLRIRESEIGLVIHLTMSDSSKLFLKKIKKGMYYLNLVRSTRVCATNFLRAVKMSNTSSSYLITTWQLRRSQRS